MQLPAGRDARWATLEYAKWLERSFFGLVRVVLDDHGGIAFHFLTEPKPLLSLVWDEEHSTSDRQLFSLGRGLLSREDDEGRFELRQVLDGETLLIAVHDYSPSLPWGIYVLTQAPAHAWVMAAFRRHLRRVGRRASTTIRDQQTAP